MFFSNDISVTANYEMDINLYSVILLPDERAYF